MQYYHNFVISLLVLCLSAQAGLAVTNCSFGEELDDPYDKSWNYVDVPNTTFPTVFNNNFTIKKQIGLDPDPWTPARLEAFAELIMPDIGGGVTPVV